MCVCVCGVCVFVCTCLSSVIFVQHSDAEADVPELKRCVDELLASWDIAEDVVKTDLIAEMYVQCLVLFIYLTWNRCRYGNAEIHGYVLRARSVKRLNLCWLCAERHLWLAVWLRRNLSSSLRNR